MLSIDKPIPINMAVATFEATEAAASVVFTTLASVKNNYFDQFNYGRPMDRADHYIFALWFLLLSFFFSSSNLSCCRLDVCHTSTHGVALVRI